MDEQTTATVGSFLSLPIPANARLSLNVHSLTVEQCDEIWGAALRRGLPAQERVSKDARWVTIGNRHSFEMTLFVPDEFPSFDGYIDRKMAGLKFIEVAAPEGATV
ncbi:MAG: hypothetical protein ACRDK4_05110 [Solirubrobacteraceae bacterium]